MKTDFSIILASSCQLLREIVIALLDCDEGVRVIAEVDDCGDTVGLVTELHPDLLVVDFGLDWATWIDMVEKLITSCPKTRVFALSLPKDDAILGSVLQAGVHGFLCRADSSAKLAAILRVVAEGGVYLSPRITGHVMEQFRNPDKRRTPRSLSALSNREIEVLKLVAEARTNKEVACALSISVDTVLAYRKSLMKKLHASNVAGLMQFAASVHLV